MNAPVQNTNKKAELLANTVEHVAIDQYDARPVIDAMRKMSFTSRDTARAADIWSMSLQDPDCSTWLTLAGSTSAGGCMHIYRDMVKYGMIDAIVATGASIVDMDFFEALGFKHYQAKSDVDDRTRVVLVDRHVLDGVGQELGLAVGIRRSVHLPKFPSEGDRPSPIEKARPGRSDRPRL